MTAIIFTLTFFVPLALIIFFWKQFLALNEKRSVSVAIIIALYIGIIASEIYSLKYLYQLQSFLTDQLIVVRLTDRHKNTKIVTQKDKKLRPKNDSLIIFGLISSTALKNGETFYNMGYPWRRKTYADLIEFFNRCGAKNIVFDILFNEKSVYRTSANPLDNGLYEKDDDDLYLAKKTDQIEKSIFPLTFSKGKDFNYYFNKLSKYPDDKILNIAKFIKYDLKDNNLNDIEKHEIVSQYSKYVLNLKKNKDIEPYSINVQFKDPKNKNKFPVVWDVQTPYKAYLGSAKYIGSVSAKQDIDGKIRRTYILIKYYDKYYPSLSFATYLAYTGFDYKKDIVSIDGNKVIVKDKTVARIDKNGLIRLKYYGWANSLNSSYDDMYSLIRVLTLKDKIHLLYNKYNEALSENEKSPLSINSPYEMYQNYNLYKELVDYLKSKKSSEKEQKLFAQQFKLAKYEKAVINGDLKGKIIILCSSAPGLQDIRPTPFLEKEIGAHIHTTAIDNLIQGDTLYALSEDFHIGFILVVSILTGIATSGRSLKRSIAAFVIFIILLYFTAHILFTEYNIILNVLIPALCVFAIFIIDTLLDYFAEKKEKGYIKDAFGQYLSPKVIDIIMKDPSKLALGGQRKQITAFFSDVAGFSSISEKLQPEELVQLLNFYLTDMCNIISQYDGTVDKFEGDAIIAFWGAPLDEKRHAMLACHSSIDMQKKLGELRKQWVMENQHPLVQNMQMRIGLNSGNAVVGNMGSLQRMDYTMMGDTVNLAARLEGANKFYKTYTMISEYTYELAKDYIDVRELDKIQVIGKKEAVSVYELIEKKNQTEYKISQGIEIYHKALKMYKDRNFREAIDLFDEVLKSIPDDGPSLTYIERCNLYIINPPDDDWDGRFILTSKG